jgi:hypothetical protein
MAAQTQQQSPPAAPSGNGQPIKVGVMPLFSTWVYLCEHGPKHLNEGLEQLAYDLMQDQRNACRRTNSGGWHFAFDLFKLEERVVGEFRDEMEQHVQAFLNYFRPGDRKKKDRFRLEGWINVNRARGSQHPSLPPRLLPVGQLLRESASGDERGRDLFPRSARSGSSDVRDAGNRFALGGLRDRYPVLARHGSPASFPVLAGASRRAVCRRGRAHFDRVQRLQSLRESLGA